MLSVPKLNDKWRSDVIIVRSIFPPSCAYLSHHEEEGLSWSKFVLPSFHRYGTVLLLHRVLNLYWNNTVLWNYALFFSCCAFVQNYGRRVFGRSGFLFLIPLPRTKIKSFGLLECWSHSDSVESTVQQILLLYRLKLFSRSNKKTRPTYEQLDSLQSFSSLSLFGSFVSSVVK